MLIICMALNMSLGSAITSNASNDVTKIVGEAQRLKLQEEVTQAIENSKKLDENKYQVVGVVDNQNSDVTYKRCDSVEEIIKVLEEAEKEMNSSRNLCIIENEPINASGTSSKKTVTKKYSKGVTPKRTLSAKITYNTKTKKITGVSKRKLSLSGITVGVSAEDKTYSTKYYNGKKKVRIRCSYSSVYHLITPSGKIEIIRKDAYQQFYYSVANGVHDGSGGFE